MHTQYETSRLYLQILDAHSAPAVTDFLCRSREAFEPFESDKAPDFFTEKYQSQILFAEYQAFLKRQYLRFYISEKENPDYIVGTVSFGSIRQLPYKDAIIGYKFDPAVHGQGYATEALNASIALVFKEWNIHRIEAFVLPDNYASIHLLDRTGFHSEGIAKEILYLHGKWQDHLRYARIKPEAFLTD